MTALIFQTGGGKSDIPGLPSEERQRERETETDSQTETETEKEFRILLPKYIYSTH